VAAVELGHEEGEVGNGVVVAVAVDVPAMEPLVIEWQGGYQLEVRVELESMEVVGRE
jgi:hypothetical protein